MKKHDLDNTHTKTAKNVQKTNQNTRNVTKDKTNKHSEDKHRYDAN